MLSPSTGDTKQACASALAGLAAGDRSSMAAWLRAHLFEHVLPFWERHGFNAEGGLLTCLADDGRVLSQDRWMWSQWRAVWVFSRLHTTFGGKDAVWRERARQVIDFCARSGWDDKGDGWALLLDRDGKILRGHESIYTDAFAVYGLVEFYRASGDPKALRLACKTADSALKKLAGSPDGIPHFPYPIPTGAKAHGVPMMWSLILGELGAVTGNDHYLQNAAAMANEVFRDFYRPQSDVMIEFARKDGGEMPPPIGTVVVPGHVIEDMWFQVHLAEQLGKMPGHANAAGQRHPKGADEKRIQEAFRLTLRHLELGWDEINGGGLLLAMDLGGRHPVAWNFADAKLWWPHTEALYAALLGWDRTRQPVFLEWYERLWQVCLDHYVDWENGEWRQKLTRRFEPFRETVALPVKDPFHLPRSLILQIELLEKAAGHSAAPTQSPPITLTTANHERQAEIVSSGSKPEARKDQGKQAKLDAVVRQGFVPIFVNDSLNSQRLVEAAATAGCRVVEYSCRRQDTRTMIPWIKREFPDLQVLAATLMDGPRVERFLKETRPGFLTVDEAVDLGADALVSFLRFRPETYARYGRRCLMIPGVSTPNEALDQIELGADLIKVTVHTTIGSEFVTKTSVPTHACIPFFVSGGLTLANVETYIQAGVVVTAAGFDMLLGGTTPAEADTARLGREAIARMMGALRSAREKHQPALSKAIAAGTTPLLAQVNRYHRTSD